MSGTRELLVTTALRLFREAARPSRAGPPAAAARREPDRNLRIALHGGVEVMAPRRPRAACSPWPCADQLPQIAYAVKLWISLAWFFTYTVQLLTPVG
jgi:hypothetical protein